MREAPVQSFGRRYEEPEPEMPTDGPVILPPVMMPPVQVPVVLIVDVRSLRAASEQISAMVAEAVQAGFDRAANETVPDERAPVDLGVIEPAAGQIP